MTNLVIVTELMKKEEFASTKLLKIQAVASDLHEKKYVDTAKVI